MQPRPALAWRTHPPPRLSLSWQALRAFFDAMAADPDRVTYGLKPVAAAAEQGAIQSLLLADSLLRAQHVQRRQTYVELCGKRDGALEPTADAHPTFAITRALGDPRWCAQTRCARSAHRCTSSRRCT